jgi:alkanesulfonate monooxygenase
MQAMVHPRVGLPMLREVFGDLSGHDLDGPLPAPLPASNALKSAYDKLVARSRTPGMTIRKLYQEQAGASGHYVFVGTPAEAADVMQDWFESRGCDGWNLIPPFVPGPAIECLEWLVPELQRRGLFQTVYQGDGTLRGSLGLPRPSFRSRGAHARENGSFIGAPRS